MPFGERLQARKIVELDLAAAERQQAPLAQLAQDAVDVDGGQAQRVRQAYWLNGQA